MFFFNWGERWDSNPRQPGSQPGLYQLSYAHHKYLPAKNLCIRLVRPAGFEPATLGLEGRCSIQMSYGRLIGRGGGI